MKVAVTAVSGQLGIAIAQQLLSFGCSAGGPHHIFLPNFADQLLRNGASQLSTYGGYSYFHEKNFVLITYKWSECLIKTYRISEIEGKKFT